MRTAWNLDSFSFVYEGSLELVGQTDSPENCRFQGSYIYRSDGAAYLDVYAHFQKETRDATHYTYALLSGNLATLRHVFERKPRASDVHLTKANPSSLRRSHSPEEVLMHREFAAFSSDNARVAAAFRFEAWEEVSGSRCLRFSRSTLAEGHKGREELQKILAGREPGLPRS